MFLDVIAWRYGTYEWAADNLADPDVWNPLRAAVEQAYPHNRRMRLCETLWVPETRTWSLTCRYAGRC